MAIAELVMPKLGESIMEATILRWHKKVGDSVKQDETVLDIATDKVDSEVPSTAAGIITEILYNENDVVPIGTVIARINTEVGASVAAAPVAPPQPVQTAPPPQPVQSAPPPPSVQQTFTPPPPPPVPEPSVPYVPAEMATPSKSGANNKFFSPLVLNIANSEGISLSELERIAGTGAEGRVTKKDILQYVADKRAGRAPIFVPPVVSAPAPQPAAAPTPAPIVETPTPILAATVVEAAQATFTPEPVAAPSPSPIVSTQVQTNSIEAEPAPTPTAAKHWPEMESPAPSYDPTPAPAPAKPVAVAAMQAPVAESVAPPQLKGTEQPIAAAVPTVGAPAVPPLAPAPTFAGKKSHPSHVTPTGNTEIIEMDRMRKLIAKHMVDSKATSPHVTSFAEADVTNMVLWRERVKGEFEKREGTKLTFTPMFIECITKVIPRFPWVNASVEGDKIIVKKDINLGMATALPSGNLIVPVIKAADQLNIVGLSHAVNGMADAARNNRLKPDDTVGGTFTLTNVGTFGSLMGTPIISQPQVAILAVGAIKKRPVVIESPNGDTIGIRHMMYLSLSYDHRIVDGSIGASFLTEVAKEMERWDINRAWYQYV